ncbi:craniofacial development protein 2 [Biomphalaria pfeifferi]|uniref:Craniofacial development protein 2 n=1 Tax=Biomphalaria pfeifferi TaxID=112525 RepID=A0AAD8CCU0_BIOPF|nr:craniofacial development protein 2 [Biomphalaria pfeifferi]
MLRLRRNHAGWSKPGLTIPVEVFRIESTPETHLKTITLPNMSTVIGTWNVRTLYSCVELKELTQRYQRDSLSLADEQVVEKLQQKKIWYRGDERNHQHGVGFIVHKERDNGIVSCKPVNSWIIGIPVEAKPLNITITSDYAMFFK